MPRWGIDVLGEVQGVGFRPHVYQAACRLGLGGFVQNCLGGVRIEVEGDEERLAQFKLSLTSAPPPWASIHNMSVTPRPAVGERRFAIRASDEAPAFQAHLPPERAVCTQCLAELWDVRNRRYRYPFMSCTQCGPRLTIAHALPFDRERTTLAQFPMCEDCRREYGDPADRRFHAQTIACAECGPRLQLILADGTPLEVDDPLDTFVTAIDSGQIGAVKGLGGFHLVCDAFNEQAVSRLRALKRRQWKPLAIMVRDLAAVDELCETSECERELLASPRSPIVLLRRRQDAGSAPSVAHDHPHLGVMLSATPLQHLLLSDLSTPAIVMTSGNRSDEPIAIDEEEAIARLGGIAELLLVHNLPLAVRCDDSVTRLVNHAESPVRRSHGSVPQPIRMPVTYRRPILAVGGQLKSTFALGVGSQALVSHHLGDLDDLSAIQAFERDIAHYERLFAISPAVVAHDWHPDYASTRYAARSGLPTIGVQHHHAHMASCMAEHGLCEKVLGVVFDGAGAGDDGTVWGGEFFIGDYRGFHRAAHLRYVGMPGGEQAVREPWRMAVAYAADAAIDIACFRLAVDPRLVRNALRLLEHEAHAPRTSSMGRLFDAVAALLGLRTHVDYEGEAAIALEHLAGEAPRCGVYPWKLVDRSAGSLPQATIDVRPMLRAIAADVVRDVSKASMARRFHATIVDVIRRTCLHLRRSTGLNQIVLSGGVFANAMLLEEAARLSDLGFEVYSHRRVPTNDGGLSLGQLAIAAQRSQGA
jgi:hydrogenase maturation protein HypF